MPFYSETFRNLKSGSISDHGESHKLIIPESSGQNGFANPVCFTSFTIAMMGYNYYLSPIYFTDIGEPTMSAYVDLNNNYNYTDDGPSITADKDGILSFRFVSQVDENISLTCQYKLILNDTSQRILFSMISKDYEKSNPYRELLDAKYWFQCTADYTKGKNLVIGQDSLCVAFIDKDKDGFYHSQFDYVALLPYGSDTVNTYVGYGCHQINDGIILGYKGKAYEIIILNTDLNSIKIKPRPDLPAPREAIHGQALPNLDVTLIDGNSVNINSLLVPGKATFINFWSSQYSSSSKFIDDLVQLKKTKGDSLTIISFCVDQDISSIRKFNIDHDVDWKQGVADSQLEQLFYYEGNTPYGVLLDKNGNVSMYVFSATFIELILSRLYE